MLLPIAAFAAAGPLRNNLAKYQLATASVQNSTYDPDFAVDGIVSNFSSYRTGSVAPGWWLQLTYPVSVTIASAHLYSGQSASSASQIVANFKFQYSNDGTNWTDVPGSAVTGNTQLERNVIFSQAVTANRFRLVGAGSGTNSYTVRELAFFPPNLSSNVEQGFPIGTDVRLNLAYLRPATASSADITNTYGPGYAKNAFDGYLDNTSRWVRTSTTVGDWIEVELGDLPKKPDAASTATAPTPVYLGSAHVYSGFMDANRAVSDATSVLSDFKLQYWDANTYAWVDIPGATVTGNTQPARAIQFTTPVTTSNVRLVATTSSATRLQELLLFPPDTSATALGREVLNMTPPVYTWTAYGTALKNTWDTYSDSSYRLNSVSSGLRLGLVNGQVVFTSTSNTTAAQTEWQLLLNIRDGSYRIRNTSSGLCLAQSDISATPGAAVVAQVYSALPTQDWFLVPDATTPANLRLVNAYSGLALQSSGSSTTAGAAMTVDTVTTARAVQQWTTAYVHAYPKKGIAAANSATSYPSAGLTTHQDLYNRLGGSWSYTWGRQTNDAFPYVSDSFTFNPMQWGNGNNNFSVTSTNTGQGPIERNYVDLQSSPKPMHLIAYNEPDSTGQSNVTVASAIARWPRLEAQQVPLVSPSPTTGDPDSWLLGTGFYSQASTLGYRTDYTSLHWYKAPNSSTLINDLLAIYNNTNNKGRPIWLTEFSFISWTGSGSWTDADNFNALAEFMWRAESLTWLKRYSIFAFVEGGSNSAVTDPSNAPRSNTLRADGSLTAFGQLYAGWDGVTSVVNSRAYHVHNKSGYRRARNLGGTSNPSLLGAETADAGVQWFLAPGVTAGTYRIISTRDGRPLRSDGTNVTFGAVGETGTAVEWKYTAYQYGWYYLDHPASNKRLKDSSGTFSMVANTTADDTVRWRFVAPAVADSISAPVITSTLTATGSLGTAFNYQITASPAPSAFAATGLPAGLSLDPATGLISGTPTTSGDYSVSLSASNYVGTGPTAVLSLSLNKVSQAAPVISSPNSMVFGANYTATANTGYGALSWSLGTGSTASGAAIDAATGAVTCSSTGTVVIKATFAGDAYHNAATSADFTVTVVSVGGTTFVLSSTSFTYTGSVQGPTVIPNPANATFTTGGIIAATSVGTYTATATANGNFSGSNNNLSWSITKASQATPVINSPSTTALGASYTATANTGFGGVIWALGNGSTATGAAINSTTGAVSFTSTGTVVIRATFAGDANHFSATSPDFTITVAASNLYWDGSGTPNATYGVTAYNPNTNWSKVSGSTAAADDPAAVPGASDTAVFGLSTPMLIGLNGARTVGGLLFSGSGATTLYSHPSANTSNTLTIGTGGLTVTSGAGAVTTVSNSTTGFLTYRLSGDQSWMNNSSNLLTMNGGIANVANTAPCTLTVGGSGAGGITLASSVANGGTTGTTSIVVNTSGGGTTTLAAANTYTGSTAVYAGLLKLGNDKSLGFGGIQTTTTVGTTVASGGTIDLNGKTVNEPITLSGTGVGDAGALINTASTTATIGSGIAGITVSALGSVGPLPTIAISGTGTGATAVVAGALTSASFTLNSGTTVYSVAPTVSISGGGGSGATATATLTGGVVSAINLTNAGSGFTSAPTITFSGGTVTTAGTNPTATGNANNFTPLGVQLTAAGSGYTGTPTYSFTGGNGTYTPGVLTLSSVTLAGDASIGGSGNITINAGIAESVQGASLTKIGAGTLTLSGANTYTGATTVNGGVLNGTGTFVGSVTISATGAFNPGTSSATGIFSAASLKLGGSTTVRINGTNRGTSYDAVNVTGALTYGGALVISMPTVTLNDSDSFQLFQAGSHVGAFTSVTINASGSANATLTDTGFSGSINGKNYTFSYATGVLQVSAPTTFALSQTTFTFTGSAQGPTINATPANATFTTGGTLSATSVGTYTATATATGNFSGSNNNLTWSITKANQAAPVINSWTSATFDEGYTATANTGYGALTWSLGTGSTAAGAAIDPLTGAVSFASTGTVVFRATFAGDASRNAATSADFTLTVGPAATGFVLSDTSFTYTGAPQGPTINPTLSNATFTAGGTLSATNVGTYTATAAATGSYVGSDSNLTWSITKATPAISWTAPEPITSGTALSATQLNATVDGVAGTFTYSPSLGTVLNVGASQTLSVTFTPSDTANYNSVTATTAITVNAATSGYDAWASTYLSTLSAADQLPSADPDRDGLPNLVEYALGTIPTVPSSAPTPTAVVNDRLQITFLRAVTDLTYEVLVSSDLVNWTVIATNPGAVSATTPVTVTDTVSFAANPRRYIRLRVTKP